jgi:hypothetical protein
MTSILFRPLIFCGSPGSSTVHIFGTLETLEASSQREDAFGPAAVLTNCHVCVLSGPRQRWFSQCRPPPQSSAAL